MANKPKRVTKYPKKLRQTLEKIAEARDEREQEKARKLTLEEMEETIIHGTYWREFLKPGTALARDFNKESVVRLDWGNHRINIDNDLYGDDFTLIKTIYVRPPWLDEQSEPNDEKDPAPE